MLIVEKYDNIYGFMDTVNTRPDNKCFGDASKDPGEWSGTKTWEDAVSQFADGLPAVADKLKKAVQLMKVKGDTITKERPMPRNHYYGYAPNIPAAIIGLPKSMRQMKRTPQKVKAITIYWKPTVNCGYDAEDIRKSGETVLQLVYALEVAGYRVKLDCDVYSGKKGTETIMCSVTLKEFKQPLDMLKLSFPMSSPAMFRRFGFRWAETVPGVKNKDWKHGYGTPINDKREFIETLKKGGVNIENSYVINVDDGANANHDPLKLAKDLGISI